MRSRQTHQVPHNIRYVSLAVMTLLLVVTSACQSPPEVTKLEVITYGPLFENLKVFKTPLLLGGIDARATFAVTVFNPTNKTLELASLNFSYLSSFGDFKDDIKLNNRKLPPGETFIFGVRRRFHGTLATYHPAFNEVKTPADLHKHVTLVGFLTVFVRSEPDSRWGQEGSRYIGNGYDDANVQNVRRVNDASQFPGTDIWF